METSLIEVPAASGDLRRLDHALAVFQAERPRLFRIANRILGSVTETEDVMQDVWLRWQRTDREDIANSSAFLATMTSRAAINVVQSARSRHEVTTASRLADLAGDATDPATTTERAEAADVIVRVLVARTSPAERAAYLLRRGFGYPYWKIAQVLHLGVANTRQLVRRAHVRVHPAGPGAVHGHAHPRLVSAFVAAAHDGDFADLEALLVADIRQSPRRGAKVEHGVPHPRHTHSTSLPALETSCMRPAISGGIGAVGSRLTPAPGDQTRFTCSSGSRSG
jgi:RNA polymerase sigma-70 factor, ECF subfamily